MRVHRLAAGVLATALMVLQIAGAAAQDSVPHSDPNAPQGKRPTGSTERLDLAAIALDGNDVPSDYALSFEAYIPGDRVAASIAGDAVSSAQVERTGLSWYYESQYESSDGQNRIRAYVEEFDSATGARDGFDLLENENLFARPGLAFVDKPGLDIGDEPSELTVGTYEATANSPSGATLDATFRVDRLLVGIAIDTVSTTPPDEDLLTEMAARLEERARTVIAGDALPGVDSNLAASLLTFDNALVVQEGYISLIDSAGQGAPADASAEYESGYIRTVALGMDSNPDLPLPIVSVAASTFSSEASALALLSQAEAVTPTYPELARERLDPIPGTSAAVAFSFASPLVSASPDSFRIMLVVDSTLITVEVQGTATLDDAREAVLDLIDQQISCIADATPCGPATFPDGIGGTVV
jgi:hypothetical protein